MRPEISVIIPLYKGKKFLENIFKMMDENYNHLKNNVTFELILINDYPEELIDISNYGDHNYKINYLINATNKGIHESRVEGIRRACGSYIHLLDQDDKISPEFYIQLYNSLSKDHNSSFIVSNGLIEHPQYTRKIYEYGFMQNMVRKPECYALLDNRIISPGQCLIKREAFPEFWLNHSMQKNGADDLLLWLLILCNNKFNPPIINKGVLYTHVNTNQNTSLDLDGMYRSVDEMLELVSEYNLLNNKLITIIGFRNDYLKGKKSEYKISLYYKVLITVIYSLRKIKNRQ